jgi:6-phosphogluconolactonase
MDAASGELTLETELPGVRNPSYLEIHPKQGLLFSVNEVQDFAGEEGGGVSAFSFDVESGETNRLNSQSSRGKDPCYISLEATGRFALVANYTGGNAAMLPIRPDGQLGPATDVVRHSGSSIDPQRQTAPFVHCIRPDPANRFAIAADLGADQLVLYRMDLENGKLDKHAEVRVRPGSGPRHLIFHRNGKYLYLINEMSSSLIVYRYHAQAGRLEETQTISTLPPDYKGRNLSADLHISGSHLYASNRGHDSIAWFLIDDTTGQLTSEGCIPSGGREPRGFAIDPSGRFLLAAHQWSDNIVCFGIDPVTGGLLPTGNEVKLSQPVCVKFAPVRIAKT